MMCLKKSLALGLFSLDAYAGRDADPEAATHDLKFIDDSADADPGAAPHDLTFIDDSALQEKFPLWWLKLKKASTLADFTMKPPTPAKSPAPAPTMPPADPEGEWTCEASELGQENTHRHEGDWPVRCRRNLPTFSKGTTGKFFYMEIPIGQNAATQFAMTISQQYHSAIMLQATDAHGKRSSYTFEMIPEDHNLFIFPHHVSDKGVDWGNASRAMVVYSKDETHMHRRWMLNKLVKTAEIGTSEDADGLNRLMEFVHEFATGEAKTTMWQVWQLWRTDKPKMEELQHNFDVLSDKFAQAMIWKIIEDESGKQNGEMIRLQRNYLSVIDDSEPEFVEADDPEVIAFYKAWLPLKTLKLPIKELLMHLQMNVVGKKPFFIYDQLRNMYAKVKSPRQLKVKYAFMPLPPKFYETCSRDAGQTCAWHKPCGFSKNARCVKNRCVCRSDMCMFQGMFGMTKGNHGKFCSV